MNLLDIVIIIIILFSGILGFKRGVFKELVKFLGIIFIFVLAYGLKNYVGDFLVINFPFFNFSNFLHGAMSSNIIFYQFIAFILVLILLYVIYELILAVTGIFEKILRFTIILGIPSKFFGLIVGLIKGVVIVYVLLFFISQPVFNFDFVNDSKYTKYILTNTPILNTITKDTLVIFEKIVDLNEIDNENEINLQMIELILDNKVTTVDVIQKLVDKQKLNVKDIDILLEKYKGE